MEIVLIAAVDINLAIGKEGKIPWDIKEDLKFFRQNTENTAIVMGRATYDSIGRDKYIVINKSINIKVMIKKKYFLLYLSATMPL